MYIVRRARGVSKIKNTRDHLLSVYINKRIGKWCTYETEPHRYRFRGKSMSKLARSQASWLTVPLRALSKAAVCRKVYWFQWRPWSLRVILAREMCVKVFYRKFHFSQKKIGERSFSSNVFSARARELSFVKVCFFIRMCSSVYLQGAPAPLTVYWATRK